MNAPNKSYAVNFNSDGVSTTLAIDASLAPISESFAGNLPKAVVSPQVTFTQPITDLTSPLSGVTAALVGTTVTLTFQTAPPQLDNNSVLVEYTASFVLQFGD